MKISNHPSDDDRASTGVLATLRALPDGKSQLIFDDVSALTTLDAYQWSQEQLFTVLEFDSVQLESMDFSKEELVEIAENILLRLTALGNFGIKSKGYNAS